MHTDKYFTTDLERISYWIDERSSPMESFFKGRFTVRVIDDVNWDLDDWWLNYCSSWYAIFFCRLSTIISVPERPANFQAGEDHFQDGMCQTNPPPSPIDDTISTEEMGLW